MFNIKLNTYMYIYLSCGVIPGWTAERNKRIYLYYKQVKK